MSNPFFYGNPVPPDQFLDRQRELHRIISRVVNQGQSTAVVGEPRSGKTSLLLYLAAPEMRDSLYDVEGEWLLFSYLDTQTLGEEFSPARFWEYALRPLYEQVIAPIPGSPLAQAYKTCQENRFGAFVLERLFTQVGLVGQRLVLMLDEFDFLLYHPILNSAEFFGSLRSLASRSRGALALVIASRRSLADLNKDTWQFSRGGSPYFNFLDEITLGPLPGKAITELLDRAGSRFMRDDRRFIEKVAGGHPYLLQAAASELWEAYEEGQDHPYRRWQQVGHSLYDIAALILADTWRLWSPAMRKAFTIVALADVARMLEQRQFYTAPLVHDKRDVEPELRLLGKQGFVTEDQTAPTGWRVRPQAFLWWLADALVCTAGDETSFEEWLRKQELGFLLTRDEKEQLGKAVHAVADLLKGGVTTLIEAAAKGIGEGVAKGVSGG